jgi:FkbM family methyltransferase
MARRGENVSFLQVGANDGQYGDPLRKYIVKYPWSGILVEPQAEVFLRLCKNYASLEDRLIFENVAVAQDQETITIYKVPTGDSEKLGGEAYASSVASFTPRIVARQLGISRQDLEPQVVTCTTLDKLIEKHGISKLDILQIDTEGEDYNVLRTLDLSRCKPSIVQFEHGHLSPKSIDEAVKYLSAHEYRVHYGGHQTDTLALHESFIADLD